MLSNAQHNYSRSVYGIIDFVGDMGGVFDLILLFLGIVLLRVSLFSYNIDIFEKIYYVKSKDPALFVNKQPVSSSQGNSEEDY
jgi:hypothetical protein